MPDPIQFLDGPTLRMLCAHCGKAMLIGGVGWTSFGVLRLVGRCTNRDCEATGIRQCQEPGIRRR